MTINEEFFNPISLDSNEIYILHEMLNTFRIPYVLYDSKQSLKLMYLTDSLPENFDLENEHFNELVSHVFKTIKPSSKTITLKNADQLLIKVIPIKAAHKLFAVLVIFQIINSALEEYQNTEIDLKTIFESSYDVIFVADGEGKAIRVSSACERLWGKSQDEFLGRSTNELEQEGIFQPSVTRLVLEQKRKVSVIQKTCTGKTLLVVGTPVTDETGKIIRVINASRDVTEINRLQEELSETRLLLEHYQHEIQKITPNKNTKQERFIYKSDKMNQLVERVKVIAKYETPILITGESGVGKEVIAGLIHEWSNRNNQPFIKVNCGAIPDNLLESELFGYEKGTFTGANKNGKTGLFLAANKGSILLDEITEMPFTLQVKLLRVLQEQEVTPIGSIHPKKINVRIISATNQNIENLIKKGTFREDLYYRINGIPIEIPPLRHRKEDILPLVTYLTESFNNYYAEGKNFTKDALKEITNSNWKGNIRELKNCVEKFLILSPTNIIDKSFIDYFLNNEQETCNEFHFEVHQDIDLYNTLAHVEKQILEYAANKYVTTVDIARSLNVNQSTVSKKLKKHHIHLNKRRM